MVILSMDVVDGRYREMFGLPTAAAGGGKVTLPNFWFRPPVIELEYDFRETEFLLLESNEEDHGLQDKNAIAPLRRVFRSYC